MTKPEVVDWLLKNGFVCKEKRKIHFYRAFEDCEYYFGMDGDPHCKIWKAEEYVNIWKGSVWLSFDGDPEEFTECGLDCVHIGERGRLILENVWKLKSWEEIHGRRYSND